MYNIKHRSEKKAQQGRQKVGVSETVKTAAKHEKRDYKDDRERERERERQRQRERERERERETHTHTHTHTHTSMIRCMDEIGS